MNDVEVKAGQYVIPISRFGLPVSSMLWPESEITIDRPSWRLDVDFHSVELLTFPQPYMGNLSLSWGFDSCEEIAPLIVGSKCRTFPGKKLLDAIFFNTCPDACLQELLGQASLLSQRPLLPLLVPKIDSLELDKSAGPLPPSEWPGRARSRAGKLPETSFLTAGARDRG